MPAGAPVDGIDLIKKLLVFNPEKRPAAENCLKHSYVARFNSKKDNLKVGYNVVPPVNDDIQLSVDEYRTRLYAMIQVRYFFLFLKLSIIDQKGPKTRTERGAPAQGSREGKRRP